jgi:phenylacetate-CoA ligase
VPRKPPPDTARSDYPVADYVPMAGTALTDAQRWPLLTAGGAAMLDRLRRHPHAPAYNHACGDRLDARARDRLRAYRSQLASGPEDGWVGSLIRRVYKTVPRYRRSGSAPNDLREVPTIGRHDLLSRVEEHVPDDVDLSELIVFRTSGSRGPAATVPMTPEFCALDLPVIEHVLATRGVTIDGGPDRVSMVNVYHQPVAYQFASVSSYLGDAGHLKINLHPSGWGASADRVSFLEDCDPEVYTGNPISLAELAELPLRCAPKAVLSGAMALGDGLRARLEERFGCPVVDLYGITEAGLIAYKDCEAHRLVPRRLFVEILDESGNRCPTGVSGEITITCGENAALPLLRYRTGDHAALRDGVLTGLEGRETVRFRSAGGAWVNSIELTHVLSPLRIVAWQLHQRADGSLSLIMHETGAPAPSLAEAAVRSLMGGVPIEVTTRDLATDAKPQRYSSDLPGAVLT